MLCSRSASLMSRTRQSVGHGHEHLADGGRLLGLLGVELEAVELGHPVDDGADLGTEVSLDDVSRVSPVSSTASCSRAAATDRASRPRSATMVGHGDGVGDVGLTGPAELAVVGLLGRPRPARTISLRSASLDRGRRAS